MTKTLFIMIVVMMALSTFLVDATPVQVLGDDATPVEDLGDDATPVQDLGDDATPFQFIGDDATPVQDLGESSVTQRGGSRVKRSAYCRWTYCGCGGYGGCHSCCV